MNKLIVFLGCVLLIGKDLRARRRTISAPTSSESTNIPLSTFLNSTSSDELDTTRAPLDFSYMPSALESYINSTGPDGSPAFSSTEKSDFLNATESDRVSGLIARDATMVKFMKTISAHCMNSCCMTEFNVNGTNQRAFYVIDEGFVDQGQDTISVAGDCACGGCNSKMFSLFLGQSISTPLSGPQLSLQASVYSARNTESNPSLQIAAVKQLRVVHPIL